MAFTIGLDGSVLDTADHGSEMPDSNVTNCVVNGFRALRFPLPDGGNVKVVYPIQFNPG